MIKVADLKKSYGDFQALKGVSFEVAAGEVFGLVGLNGAGKSTLAKILMGFLKPDSGEAEISGLNVLKNPVKTRENIGYLPEESVLYNELSALEHLEMVIDLRQLDKRVAMPQAEKILDFLDLDEARARPVGGYSKGMRRKTAVACSLLGDPPALLFDEPTSGLDPDGALRFSEILQELKRKGRAIIVTSHVLPEIEQRADRFGVLDRGQLVACASLQDLRAQAERPEASLEELFLHFTGRERHEARGLFDGVEEAS